MEVTSEVEKSFLVAIMYLVMERLNGSKLALISRRNFRERKKMILFIFLITFKLILALIFIHECLRSFA